MTRRLTAGVILMSFLAALDSTVVSTAMPRVVESLGGMALYAWVFTAYMVPMVVAGPLWGKLADLYGHRGVYLGCWAAFTLGSLGCALTGSMELLIVFRVVQGIGAGGLVPMGQAILALTYDAEARARVQTWITLVYGFASAFGPWLGAFFAEQLTWRWAFGINLPVALVALVLLLGTLPSHPAEKVRLDGLGALLLTFFLAILLLGLEQGGWPVFAAAAVLLALLVRQERRHPDPLLPPALFACRAWLATAILMVFGGAMLFGTLVYLPLYCQKVLGMDPSQSAHVVTPLMVAWMTLSAFTARLALRIGYRWCAALGGFSYVGAFALLPGATSPWTLAVAGGLVGLGAGLTMVPLLLFAQAAVPRELMGIATAGILLSRNLGSSVGVAVLGAVAGPELALTRSFHVLLGVAAASLACAWLVPRIPKL